MGLATQQPFLWGTKAEGGWEGSGRANCQIWCRSSAGRKGKRGNVFDALTVVCFLLGELYGVGSGELMEVFDIFVDWVV